MLAASQRKEACPPGSQTGGCGDHAAAPAEPGGFERDPVLRGCIIGIFIILLTAALRLSAVIALPVTAGVIFGLVLGPPVDWLVRHRMPQHLAAGLIVCAGGIVTLAAAALLAVPLAAWSDQLPAMMEALRARLAGIGGVLHELETVAATITGAGGLAVSEGSPLMSIAMSSSAAAGEALIFIATVYFYLATRRPMKARVLRLCLGRTARKSAGSFFEDIESRVARYFGLVTLVNAVVGLAAGLIAWVSGLPFPVFWGALAFLFNYIAFIGPIIVAVLLFAAGLIASPAPLPALAPALAFLAVHVVESNLVTPLFVGARLTISPFLVLLSFVFWLWLWGPVGAVLSTPILLVAAAGVETLRHHRDEAAEDGGPGQSEDLAS